METPSIHFDSRLVPEDLKKSMLEIFDTVCISVSYTIY